MSLLLGIESPKVTMALIKALMPQANFGYINKTVGWIVYVGDSDGGQLLMNEPPSGSYFEDQHTEIIMIDINHGERNSELIKAFENAGFSLADWEDKAMEGIYGKVDETKD